MDIELLQQQIEEGQRRLPKERPVSRKDFVDLQMVMVNSSLTHEYARKAYEKCKSYHSRQQILERMESLKTLYYDARAKLEMMNPDRLETMEKELVLQKQNVFSDIVLQ